VIEFNAPATASGGDFNLNNANGHLLVVEPIEYRQGIETKFGEKDAILCTVHDIKAQTTTTDVLWFGSVLILSLKNQVGRRVLGVLGQGANTKGNPPWMLNDASGDAAAVAAATTYLTSATAATLTAPTGRNLDLEAAIGNLNAAVLVSNEAPF
jgi:hypothetical protein